MSRRERRADQGAVLVIFALCMVVILTLVAFAVDLGKARFSGRDNQQATDLASLSAGYFLAGNGVTPAVGQPRAACEAALSSMTTNLEGFSLSASAMTAACNPFPASAPSPCTITTTLATDPSPLVVGQYRVYVQWPMTTSQINDARFSGVGANDGTNDCERMRIRLEKTEPTSFAGIIGVPSVSSKGETVVRGGPSVDKLGIAALLLLEREGCGTLYASGQGNVVVKSVQDPDNAAVYRPGVISGDTAGSTTSFGNSLTCGTGDSANKSNFPIYAACNPNGRIVAEDAPDGTKGVIGIYSLKVGGKPGSCYSATAPSGLSVDPAPAGITSRKPADDRFNPSTRPAISNLHQTGYTAAVTNATTTSGTVKSSNAACSPGNGTTIFAETGTITFNCGNQGFKVAGNATVSIPNATTVKFIGGVDVAGSLDVASATTVTIARSTASGNGRLVVSGSASFGKARSVYVGGTPTSCTQSNNCSAVSVSGALRVNTGAIGTQTCADGPGASPGSTATNWTELATFGGSVDISSSVSLCQTMLYVGKSQAAYAADQRSSGGINCSASLPCPALTTVQSRDYFTLNGGSSSIRWSAPNQTTSDPDATNPFEGLALWTEATGTSEIKGTGTLVTTGVFFLPNALFDFNGQATADNPFNAQFFARTLQFSGQGDLNLSPNPRDSVKTAVPGSFALIR